MVHFPRTNTNQWNVYQFLLPFLHPQTLEFDREGLTKLKKAVKAIHNSGNSKLNDNSSSSSTRYKQTTQRSDHHVLESTSACPPTDRLFFVSSSR